jgi:phage terminase large subunit GpA-like protein
MAMGRHSLTPREFAYASSADLIADCFDIAFRPARRVSIADYAAEHRWLANEGGGYVGRWNHDTVPYLIEIMDALNTHATVAVVGPGQCAKTSVAENWLLQAVGCNPGGMLWYLQGKEAADAYVKSRINPMIGAHAALRDRLVKGAINNSLDLKNFGTMQVEFLGASRSTMINKSAPRIVLDELDAYVENLGDAVDLANIRRQSFGEDSRLLAMSHCDRAGGLAEHKWSAGILALYRQSDRRLWYWPCVECGAWSSPHPLGRWHMALVYPDDATPEQARVEARLLCPHCGVLLTEEARRPMLRNGRWIGRGQDIAEDGTVAGELIEGGVAGFWIVGSMSPFSWGGIGGLAESRVRARRAIDTDGDAGLREIMVKRWGLPYDADQVVGAIDAVVLAERADRDLDLGVVPHWVRFLTAMVDVQGNRFEILVRGWGLDGESVVVDMRREAADPASNAQDWDGLMQWASSAAYPLDDGTGRVMRVRCTGIDSGGPPGSTEQAYAAWRRLRRDKAVRPLGRVGGRDTWSVLLLKGLAGLQAPRLTVTYPDTARKDRRAALRGEVPIGGFNPNVWKDAVYGTLGVAPPAAGAVHFPGVLRGNFGAPEAERTVEGPHTWFDQIVAETRKKSGAWEQIRPRNEALDLLVGTHVVASLIGLGRFDWSTPPAWAAEWHRNPHVVTPARPAADDRVHDDQAGDRGAGDGGAGDGGAAELGRVVAPIAPPIAAAAAATSSAAKQNGTRRYA